MNGILNINKPSGMTSHDVVALLRRLLDEKKAGHTGTLDPDATGVLVICLGKATRIIQFLEDDEKGYSGTIILGIATDTLDAKGKIIRAISSYDIEPESIIQAFNSFIGEIDQIPPMVSAIKVHGKRLYKIARQGETIERKARKVNIYNLEINGIYKEAVSFINSPGLFTKVDFSVTCSRGTYVRTLASDIGDSLGTGACLSGLVRTKSGMFKLEDSISLDRVKENALNANHALQSIDESLSYLPRVVISDSAAKRFSNGNSIDESEIIMREASCDISEKPIRIYNRTGLLLGIGKASKLDAGSTIYRALKVLN